MAQRIVATGGGGFGKSLDNLLLERHILSLARRPNPRVCYIAAASGDGDAYVLRFYRAFTKLACRPTDLPLFMREVRDLESFLLAQDVIYVAGGNTANLLAIWRVHGVDEILRRAWDEGIVLCGRSAGMNCWFEQSVTDSFDRENLDGLDDGLGLLPGSCCPHYDGEPMRRPVYTRLVNEGALKPGYAADNGVGLVFEGTTLVEAVAAVPNAAAWRVEPGRETRLHTRQLTP
jgi:peptidase E